MKGWADYTEFKKEAERRMFYKDDKDFVSTSKRTRRRGTNCSSFTPKNTSRCS